MKGQGRDAVRESEAVGVSAHGWRHCSQGGKIRFTVNSAMVLTLDAGINLVLGILLLLFPRAVVSALGMPAADVAFYPSILGAVLVGIGIALVIERVRGASGLGLAGAISINLAGGAALAGWLLSGSLAIPARGRAILWTLVVVLVGISAVELSAYARRRGERPA